MSAEQAYNAHGDLLAAGAHGGGAALDGKAAVVLDASSGLASTGKRM